MSRYSTGRRWARAAGRRCAALGLTRRWGAKAAGTRARADVRGAADERQGRSKRAGARQGHAAGRAAGPTGCALGALSLFLARFDSVLFLSQIFRHCL